MFMSIQVNKEKWDERISSQVVLQCTKDIFIIYNWEANTMSCMQYSIKSAIIQNIDEQKTNEFDKLKSLHYNIS